MGIAATIPEDIPRERYDRIRQPCLGDVPLADVLAGRYQDPAPASADDDGQLLGEVEQLLERSCVYYHDVLPHFADRPDRAVIGAIAQLSADGRLEWHAEGRYRVPGH